MKAITEHRAFFTLWLAQFISLLATDIMRFAMRVWTYQKSGSVTQFALITFFAEAPALLLSPLAGVIVDRYDRKKVILLSDAGSACATACLFYLFLNSRLEYYHIYAANAFSSVMNSFHWPAFTASVSLLVPKDQLGRFGGLTQFGPALSMLLGPGMTSALLNALSLNGIFVLEIVSFAFALFITLSTYIPNPTKEQEELIKRKSVCGDILVALSFISARPALLALLFFLANSHFTVGMVQVLMTPLILSLSGPAMLGLTLTLSGTGALFGSILLILWGGPDRKVLGVLGCGVLQGLLLVACAFAPSAYLILFVAFTYMFFIPLTAQVRVCRESIWQRKVPPEMQGRIFALQRMITQLALPIAAVISGPITDLYFEPALAEEGLLAPVLGPYIGTGKGRGAALFFVVVGLTNIGASIAGLLYSPLRRVDVDMPDALPSKKAD